MNEARMGGTMHLLVGLACMVLAGSALARARWQPRAAEMSAEPKQVIMLDGSGHGIRALVDEKPDLMQDVIAALKR